MNENPYLIKSKDSFLYLNYKDFLGVPAGTLIKNDSFNSSEIDNFIVKSCFQASGNQALNGKENHRLVRLNQKHTNIVIPAGDNTNDPADGVFTDSTGYILLVRTADCFPVFLYDGSIAGLLHLGWRSVLTGILGNFFYTVPGFNNDKARAVIGPGIGSCCFEVSSEVLILFDEKYRQRRNGKFFIDLKRLILDELAEFGIKYTLTSESCTVCDKELFYSYRREGPEVKHMISYISLGG